MRDRSREGPVQLISGGLRVPLLMSVSMDAQRVRGPRVISYFLGIELVGSGSYHLVSRDCTTGTRIRLQCRLSMLRLR